MSSPLDVQRNLDHCMRNIKGVGEAMADDVHEAAMSLSTAEMMLASASYTVHKHAGQLTQAPTQPDTREGSQATVAVQARQGATAVGKVAMVVMLMHPCLEKL
jgi:hypothetical protein